MFCGVTASTYVTYYRHAFITCIPRIAAANRCVEVTLPPSGTILYGCKMAEPNVEQAVKDYATVASLAEEILADKQQVVEEHRQISFVLLI